VNPERGDLAAGVLNPGRCAISLVAASLDTDG
jgi:hypothetical protein